jgi:pilus assembly protein Flp/PilA
LADENGATAIEYALIAGGIAVAIVTAVNSLGTKVTSLFVSVDTAMQ